MILMRLDLFYYWKFEGLNCAGQFILTVIHEGKIFRLPFGIECRLQSVDNFKILITQGNKTLFDIDGPNYVVKKFEFLSKSQQTIFHLIMPALCNALAKDQRIIEPRKYSYWLTGYEVANDVLVEADVFVQMEVVCDEDWIIEVLGGYSINPHT